METKFKDVAHLYLGCEIKENVGLIKNYKLFLDKVTRNNPSEICEVGNERFSKRLYFREFQPILYPLSAITEDIVRKWYKVACEHLGINEDMSNERIKWATKAMCNKGIGAMEFDNESKEDVALIPIFFNFLLSEHFDLFNLIPSGQAIDATTLSK